MTEIIGNAFNYGYKVGDTVKYYSGFYEVGEDGRARGEGGFISFWDSPGDYTLISRAEKSAGKNLEIKAGSMYEALSKKTGGPSGYYDFPFKDWQTVNDMVEYLSEKKWGSLSWIFKDIFKAMTRWGDKEGTTKDYDARKIIYYGLRLLRSVSGRKAVADYLKELSNNEQFKE